MSDLEQALGDVTSLFEKLGTAYAIMGGIAVRIYGIPRATYDVDFTLAIPRERLPELYERISELDFTVPEAYQSGWVDRVAGMPVVKFRLYLEGRGVDVDVFLAESPFQEQVIARRRRVDYGGRVLSFVSPEDLILLKLVAGRTRDLSDVGDVLFVQGQLDEAYLRKWAESLGVLAKLEEALSKEG